jgi:hypothetical protein
MNGKEGEQTLRRRWLLLLIALVLLTPLGLVSAQQINRSGRSPAVGSAQVVTQGIARLPDEEVVWRIVKRQAVPRAQAKLVRRDLGFILASDEPILLTNATDGEPQDIAHLNPGESFLVLGGTKQARASMGDEPVDYIAMELVPASEAEDVGSADLLFVSDPFVPPTGERDLDLIRNVLELGKTGTIPDVGGSVAILATDGAIDIIPGGGGEKVRLNAGESALFPAGELEIESVVPAKLSGAKQLPVSQLTNNLLQGDSQSSAYVVAVIGEEIPPLPTPTATAVPIEIPSPTPTPTPTETAEPETTGSISLLIYNCPEGMTIETLVGDACDLAEGAFDYALTTPSGDILTLNGTRFTDAGFTWSGLELGTYTLAPTLLPDGFDSSFIPGSAAVGGNGDGTYSVTIDESAPDIQLTAYNFQPAAPEPEVTGSITVMLYGCPSGMTPDDYAPTGCTPLTDGWDVALYGDQFPNGLTEADGSALAGGVTWSDLPAGTYGLVQTVFPGQFSDYDVQGSNADSPYGGFGVAISADAPDYTVAVYDFVEEGPTLGPGGT